MDVSDVDDWRARFGSAFPFGAHKIQSIESRRARMSDLLILDVLLLRGGIRRPDMLFPPTDWSSLQNLLEAIDQSVYDILKKDCLVYILLKWAWDDSAWEARYVRERCIAPQFAALAEAYWLLDTGTHLAKAVSILADARLNRDYVSKILQALALSSSSASLANGTAPATASLIVNYVRTAKPLLTEPDDIDLYAISLARLSFMDAWAYQKSFPEGSDTRERLLGKIVAWSLMPTPKQEPLAQLVALSLSSYEQSALYSFALPSQFATSASLSNLAPLTAPIFRPALSPHAVSILQDLLCVRAIQSGDYVRAIKLDREFSSVSSSGGSSSNMVAQATSYGRDTIDRKSIIQDLFATLPPAERTLLEDEIGKIATGVRTHTSLPFAPKHAAARKPLTTESSLSASWEDVGVHTASPAPSGSTPVSSSAARAGLASRDTSTPASAAVTAHQSPFATSPFVSQVPRAPQALSTHQAPPNPKFTAFGSPIPVTKDTNTGVIERSKALFGTSAANGQNATSKISTRSLFETAGSAKNAPNAFYKPPPVSAKAMSVGMGSLFAGTDMAKSVERATKTQAVKSANEDVKMKSGSDTEMVEENGRNQLEAEEQEEVNSTDEEEDAGNFITPDKSGAADLTLNPRQVDSAMTEDNLDLGFSVFDGSRSTAKSASASERKSGNGNGNGHTSYATSPPRAHLSPPRDGEESLNLSVNSTTTSRRHVLPGAFHEEEEEEDHSANKNRDEEHDDRVSVTKPIGTPRRSTRTKSQTHTPTPPRHSRGSKGASTVTAPRRSPRMARPRQSIPGSLMGEYEDERMDEDTEMEEQEARIKEEEDAVPPLPAARPSRRTRTSGAHPSASEGKSKDKDKDKEKNKTRTPMQARRSLNLETKTPVRRSSRLSIASSMSPELELELEHELPNVEMVSPTKKGRKSTALSRASMGGSGSVPAVATRSSTRRKQR